MGAFRKDSEGVLKVNPNLVTQGFENAERNFVRKDSPTSHRENLRLVLTFKSLQSWKIYSKAGKSAFLQGKQINRSALEASQRRQHKVWKLNKTVCGLCHPQGVWYLSVKEKCLYMRSIKCKNDDAIFFWHNDQLLLDIL